MKPDISEFSYGFAVVDELINWRGLNLTAVPIYPSLYEEGQAGKGYDVRLDTPHLPLFLQFKLSHCMIRKNAFECRFLGFNVPFYRMKIRSSYFSNQHESLLNLEMIGNQVYYVAPFFYLPGELNNYYLNRRICNNSIFVRPTAIGPLPDQGSHCVSFENTQYGYFCSEPHKIDAKFDWESFTDLIKEAFNNDNKLYTRDRYSYLANNMIEIVSGLKTRKSVDFKELPIKMSPLRQVAYLARTFFNCEFLIISSK
jgi:hypothetical protein